MQYPLSERGVSNFKVFLTLVLLFLVIHVGLKVVPMYMDAERLKDEMSIKASVAQVLKDDEILADLVRKAEELELPLKAENFVLVRDEDHHRMRISTKWDVDVVFLWGVYERNFHFDPSVDEDYSIVRR